MALFNRDPEFYIVFEGDELQALSTENFDSAEDVEKSGYRLILDKHGFHRKIRAESVSDAIGKFSQLHSDDITRNLELIQKHQDKLVSNQKKHEHERSINSVLVSTTSVITSDLKIVNNFGVVTITIVQGSNIFRDIGAAFGDIVGGKSNVLMNKFKDMKQEAIFNLKEEADALGANAIIGLTIDTEEISGGNKSMLLITATGTAVSVI